MAVLIVGNNGKREIQKGIIRNVSATEHSVVRNFGWGSGVTEVGSKCREASLPEPDFEQRGGQWVVTIWRDWLTADIIASISLNDRQIHAIHFLKTHGKISNTEYQQVADCIKKTATRDLNNLKERGIIEQIGNRGPGVHYVIAKRRDKMGTMGT